MPRSNCCLRHSVGATVQVIEDMGCLSELPDDIIHHIISHLTNKEALRLSISSKELWSAMRKRPTLVFDYESIIPEKLGSVAKWNKRYIKELKYMLSTLVRYEEENIDLETFTLEATSYFDYTIGDLYDRCIELAAKKDLRNLNLSIRNVNYVLPVPIFGVESLEDLSLGTCRLQEETKILCHNLKRLCLHSVSCSEEMFENITRGCPSIETLEIYQCCWGVSNFSFNASYLHNLKHLNARLYFSQTIKVNATQNLESLACHYTDLANENCGINLCQSEYQNLRRLSLYADVGIDGSFSDNLGHKFPHLEDLSIQYNYKLRKINISSPSLKKVLLVNFNELLEARFDVPSIVVFECHNYMNHGFRINNMMPKLSIKGNSGGWISRVKVTCYSKVDVSLWFLQLKTFLAALNGSETYVSVYFGGDAAFNVAQMAANSSPSQQIREFFIERNHRWFSLSSVPAILDGIFRICRPETITWQHYWGDYTCPKLLYEMLVLGHVYAYPISSSDDSGCSNFQHTKLWNVTDIEIFPHASSSRESNVYYFKQGRGIQLPQTSNCEQYLELLKVHENCNRITIGFNLKWRSGDIPTEQKD